jgi:hypothetical protein
MVVGYLAFDLLVLIVTLCNRVALYGLITVLRLLVLYKFYNYLRRSLMLA